MFSFSIFIFNIFVFAFYYVVASVIFVFFYLMVESLLLKIGEPLFVQKPFRTNEGVPIFRTNDLPFRRCDFRRNGRNSEDYRRHFRFLWLDNLFIFNFFPILCSTTREARQVRNYIQIEMIVLKCLQWSESNFLPSRRTALHFFKSVFIKCYSSSNSPIDLISLPSSPNIF